MTAIYSCHMLMSVLSFLGLKEVQMRAHDFKLYKSSHFDRKTANINVSLSAAPKLALGTASRCYCDVN